MTPLTPHLAYTRAQRIAHAEQHILAMYEIHELEVPQSRHVAATYGIPEYESALKAMKANFRNELSFGEGK